MINFNHLYYFYRVASGGSMTEVARMLKIAQPALSIQIRTLERSLGLQLFEKIGRRLHLTPDGERVFEYGKKMFETAAELQDFLTSSSTEVLQRCRIGISPEIERPFVGDVLSSLLKANRSAPKKILLSLRTFETGDLVKRLITNDIDVVVTNTFSSGSELHLLAELRMPVFAFAGGRLYKELKGWPKVSVAKIIRQSNVDLVLPTPELKLRLETDLFLQANRIRNSIGLESDILSVVGRAVVEGAGIGFIPEAYMHKDLQEKRVHKLGDSKPLWTASVFVFCRRDEASRPTMKSIRENFLNLYK